MKMLRYLVVVAAVGLAVAAVAGSARADGVPPGGFAGPVYGGPPPGYGPGPGPGYGADPHAMPPTLARALMQDSPRQHQGGKRVQQFFQNFQKPKLPVFQAAPWYNYWPYDGHFLTPAPINGQFYGPPMTGNFPVNPYFPGAGIPSGYGSMPGGPPPIPK